MPVNLGKWRAARSEMAADWTPIEMLRALLDEWEAHPVEAPSDVVLVCDFGDAYRYAVAGRAAPITHIGMLAAAQHSLIQDGFSDEAP